LKGNNYFCYSDNHNKQGTALPKQNIYQIFKHVINKRTLDIQKALNVTFLDIRFLYVWTKTNPLEVLSSYGFIYAAPSLLYNFIRNSAGHEILVRI